MRLPPLLVAVALVGALPSAAADQVVIDTALGSIRIELLRDQAPRHVENFIKLAREGFYDGTTFHRAIPGYIIQGGSPTSKDGDPKNDNFGMPNYTLKAEFNDLVHERGAVSMARNIDDPDSAGSQFFVMLGRAPQLDQIRFTVFGRVVSGMEVADRIAAGPRDEENFDRPLDPVLVARVRIVEGGASEPVRAGSPAVASPSGSADSAPPARLQVVPATVNVRRGPGTDSPVVSRLRRGAVLVVKAKSGEWFEVELAGGASGYVREDMVEAAP